MPSATPDLPKHWSTFLDAVDRALSRPVALHCLGGFVLEVVHGHARVTGDLDYIEIIPSDAMKEVQAIAGVDSDLAKKHRLYFQHVGVVSLPESYEERLTELYPGRFRNLRLFEVEAHDLALSKLARNSPIDREDVAYLAKTVPLDPALLKTRYTKELRGIIIGNVDWHDGTLAMWIEAYFG